MQLNRNSGIVRYWKRVAWWMSDAEKQKQLAEGTNLCAFVREITIGTTLVVLYWALLSAYAIILWPVSCVVLLIGVCFGFVPVRWKGGWRGELERWGYPVLCWEFEDRVHFTIHGRKLYFWHAFAVVALGIAGHALVGLWSTQFVPAFRQLYQEQSGFLLLVITILGLMAILLACTVAGYTMDGIRWFVRTVRSSDSWRMLVAWLRAKKDRVCPRIEFVE